MRCASCAAPIQIKPETTEFVCSYCGTAQVVDRSGGIVTLNVVAETLEKVQHGTDRIAAELALARLYRERDNSCFGIVGNRYLHEVQEEIEKYEAFLQPKRKVKVPEYVPAPEPSRPAGDPAKSRSTKIGACEHCGSVDVARDQTGRYILWCHNCKKYL